jgi:hypothetical protein
VTFKIEILTLSHVPSPLGSKFRRNFDLLQLRNRSGVGTSTETSDEFRHCFFNLSLNLKFLNLNVFENDLSESCEAQNGIAKASPIGLVVSGGDYAL